MNRTKVQLMLVLFFIFCAISVTYADENEPSNKRAFEILNNHIRSGYFPVRINTSTYFRVKDDKRFNSMHNVLMKLKAKGLLDFSIKNKVLTKVLNAHLTSKGENTPHAISGFDHDMIGFVCGERTILEINKVDSSSGYIYFTYSFTPDELGYFLGSTKDEKNKGRAKIIFDSLSDRYIFKGFEYYSVKAGRWVPTSWAQHKDDQQIFYFGIIKRP